MNKSLKIFLKIIYYIFTFGLGILLALILPGLIMTANIPSHIEVYLNEGKYSESMNLLVAFDDKEIAYQTTFDDGSGLVLFRALVDVEEKDEDGNKKTYVYYSYSGFLYGTKDNYKTSKLLDNRTKLIVNNGVEDVKITLLNYDSDEDGLFDEISSKYSCTYVPFDIRKDKVSQIESISFMDSNGDIYQTAKVSLGFDNKFFTALEDFVEEYNGDNPKTENLKKLEEEFLGLSSNYEKCSYANEKKLAQKDGIIIVLIYFIAVYLIADFLVGQHFIIRFFVWISRKIRHKEVEEKKTEEGTKDVYGTDYYTMLTFKLLVPKDCDINVSINYHNETDQIEMILSKDKDYTIQQRVHAGTYVNAWLECPGYVSQNLPATLEVRGYTMNVEVTLRKEEEKALDTTQN